MKKLIAGMTLSALGLFAMPNDPLELVLLSKAAEKKAIVLATMHLDPLTQEKFGSLYDEYQGKLMKQRIEELNVIAEYAKDYNNMTDDKANKLISRWLTVEEAEMALKKDYIAKFKKIIPPSDVIRYFQIENRIQLMREMERSNMIPLAIPAPAQTPPPPPAAPFPGK